MWYYSLTWFQSITNTKVGTKRNPIDVQQMEYHEYFSTKEDILKKTQKEHNFNLLHLT
jgi:hypothetical protein